MKTNQTHLYYAEMKKLGRLQNGTVRFLRQSKGFRPNCSFMENLPNRLESLRYLIPVEHPVSTAAGLGRSIRAIPAVPVRAKHANKPCWNGVFYLLGVF